VSAVRWIEEPAALGSYWEMTRPTRLTFLAVVLLVAGTAFVLEQMKRRI